jgi:hypothetical protein
MTIGCGVRRQCMRRRTVAWIAGSLLLAGFLSFVWLHVGKRLNVESFSQIQFGMTQSEVEKLLGGPPGNYGRYSEKSGFMTLEGYFAPASAVEKVWCDDAHRFEVYFDPEGRVVGLHKRAGYEQGSAPSWLERLRAWLGL